MGDSIIRQPNGRFAAGWKGGPGRPARWESERLQFAERMRAAIKKHKLAPELLVEWALDPKQPVQVRLEVVKTMLLFAFGRPATVNIANISLNEGQPVVYEPKHIIGITHTETGEVIPGGWDKI
jgi:hypothetical protein